MDILSKIGIWKKGEMYHIPVVHAAFECIDEPKKQKEVARMTKKAMDELIPDFDKAADSAFEKAKKQGKPIRVYIDSLTPERGEGLDELMSKIRGALKGKPDIFKKLALRTAFKQRFEEGLDFAEELPIGHLCNKIAGLKFEGYDIKIRGVEDPKIDPHDIKGRDRHISREVNRFARQELNAVHITFYGANHKPPKNSKPLLDPEKVKRRLERALQK